MRIFPILFLLLLTACQRPEPTEEIPVGTDFRQQLLVANEGPFQNGSGTITAYVPGENAVQDVYQSTNPEQPPLGNILQSIYRDENRSWLVINNAARVVVADSRTLKHLHTIEGFESPRYFQPLNEQTGVVSQWGNDLRTGSLAFVDLESMEIMEKLEVGPGPEAMVLRGNRLYVAQAGGLERDSVVTIISLANRAVSERLVVGQNPQSMALTLDGFWVLAQGYYADFSNPDNPQNRPGALTLVENDEVVAQYSVPLGSKNLIRTPEGVLYFLSGGVYGQIARFDPRNPSPQLELLTERQFYGLQYDPVLRELYATDAQFFQIDGQVLILNEEGVVRDSFVAGLGPGYVALPLR